MLGYSGRTVDRGFEHRPRVGVVDCFNPTRIGASAGVEQSTGCADKGFGPRTVEHVKDNLAAADWSLTEEQVDRLTTASAPDTVPYPYGVLARLSRR